MSSGDAHSRTVSPLPRRPLGNEGVRLFLWIDHEPGVLARVLEPFATWGHAPRALVLRPAAGGTAFLAAEFDGPDGARAAHLTERLRQMPCVIGARLSCELTRGLRPLRRPTDT